MITISTLIHVKFQMQITVTAESEKNDDSKPVAKIYNTLSRKVAFFEKTVRPWLAKSK